MLQHLFVFVCVLQVWTWVQQGRSVLSNSSEAGQQLSEAEDALNKHLQLHTQAEVHTYTLTHTHIIFSKSFCPSRKTAVKFVQLLRTDSQMTTD